MKYLDLDETRPLDLILLGRAAVDFNPVDYFKPLETCTTFAMYVGGSPANIAVGVSRHGLKAGFLSRVSDDKLGVFVTNFFEKEGIDTSHIKKCTNGEKIGLTFTEILGPSDSNITMYRTKAADLQLSPEDIDEDYIKKAKALLISGTALAESPSREAALKAMMLAIRNKTAIIFDVDYRPYNWKSDDEMSIYYSIVAKHADIILGSREEYDITERLIEPGRTDRQSADAWFAENAKIVIIKHGKKGSTAYTKDGKSFSISPYPIETLKTFGGGDGYASGFLYGVFQGWDIGRCLEFGSAEASIMCASHSCSQDLPNPEKVEAFLKENKEKYGEVLVENKE